MIEEITVNITTEFIKLDQLLKFAGIVMTGGDAKYFIQNGYVSIDNDIVTQRGKKIRKNTTVNVEYQEQNYLIIVN